MDDPYSPHLVRRAYPPAILHRDFKFASNEGLTTSDNPDGAAGHRSQRESRTSTAVISLDSRFF